MGPGGFRLEVLGSVWSGQLGSECRAHQAALRSRRQKNVDPSLYLDRILMSWCKLTNVMVALKDA